jgi:CheY-like chemotaxis protein
MVRPLALLHYEQLLPGTQLLNRLQDLGYRVQSSNDPRALVSVARQEKPMVILADLTSNSADVTSLLRDLKAHPDTRHIPVLAFSDPGNRPLQEAAVAAGADLVAGSDGILEQLDALLDQALHVD